MPRAKKEENVIDPVALGSQLVMQGGESDEELRKSLNALLLQQLNEQLEAKQSEEARRKARMEEMRVELAADKAAVELKQANCAHIKEDQTTAFRGQELSNGTLHLQCQRCRLKLTDELAKSRPNLVPNGDFIGRSQGSW